ncbi:MAG: DNA-deoxyinosine glycosylase [Desulfoprunum sp.]|nr:DNA-deoxyinosine glycosylase [Desulfoprunum sp.]
MISSFAPVADPNARILILGSIPGRESLRQQQYYAHPRNAFWRIMAELFDASPDLSYRERLALLTANRLALWDVIETCCRPSSLDSDIEQASIRVNDFRRFLADHRQIEVILFNGGKAWKTFNRQILPSLDTTNHPLTFRPLPSTSPANAGYSYNQKLAAWQAVLGTQTT